MATETTEIPIPNVSFEEKLLPIVDTIGNGAKPWFLTSSIIYQAIKDVVVSIPQGSALFENSLSTISTITKYINSSTKLNIVLEVDKLHDLINFIDSTLSTQLMIVDDGFDEARLKFSSSLRHLVSAIIKHREWAEEYVAERTTEFRANAEDTYKTIKTRYEQALEVLKLIAEFAKEQFPDTFNKANGLIEYVHKQGSAVHHTTVECIGSAVGTAKGVVTFAKESVTTVQGKIDSNVIATAKYFLNVAQPYVRQTVANYQPYFLQALTYSKPYIEKAQPVLEPIITKATDVTKKAQENPTYGKLVTAIIATATVTIDEAKNYCLPEEPSTTKATIVVGAK